jgi:hypothetical protein
MGRRKRSITSDGLVICKFDPDNWHAAHYTEFYGWDKAPLDYWFDPVEKIWIGHIASWCREDQKRYTQSRYRPRSEPEDPRVEQALAEYRLSEPSPEPPKVYERLEPITDLSFLKDA